MIRSSLIKLYVGFKQIRFYHDTDPSKAELVETFEIKAANDYQGKFSFWKENRSYLTRSWFGHMKKHNAVIYSVSAVWSEEAPIALKDHNSVKLHVGTRRLVSINEKEIMQILLSTYLDFINQQITEAVAV